MKKIVVFILVIFTLASCKNDKKVDNSNKGNEQIIDLDQDNNSETEKVDDSERFIITIDAIVTKDDKFNLMYLTEEITSWSPQGLLKREVYASDVAQKIKFKFPPGVFPTKFRVDLGTNKNQGLIDFYKITFEYEGQELVVEEKMINKYFIPNKYASFSKDDKADLNLFEVDGKYNPLIIATDYFMDRLDINLY